MCVGGAHFSCTRKEMGGTVATAKEEEKVVVSFNAIRTTHFITDRCATINQSSKLAKWRRRPLETIDGWAVFVHYCNCNYFY